MSFASDQITQKPVISYERDIEGLRIGQRVKITVRDHEKVAHFARGKSYAVTFEGINWIDPHSHIAPHAPSVDDEYLAMYVLLYASDNEQKYGFHGWLIEKIEALDGKG